MHIFYPNNVHFKKASYHHSANLSNISGGDEGTRTPGLLRAREALSHLSYIPHMGHNGLEPLTFPLSEECSKPAELVARSPFNN